eukprot:CAMPEP_0196823264 /NCGR_PEP_ID=MMETSP1362-20130617/86770_1 /TAXON_ID=163516 /ORGANISM="Leptocylindrus danicus, Strain CCMP1856" /LENGTH=130 /DNA_ID=CAMNT_0042203079 /DNA_START=120 /DNA_END=509 /DNA_ORIENTATION=-
MDMLDESFFGWSQDDAQALFEQLHIVEEPSQLQAMQNIYVSIDLFLPIFSTAFLSSAMILFLDDGSSNSGDKRLRTARFGFIPLSAVLGGIIDLCIENVSIYLLLSQYLAHGSFSDGISCIGGWATLLKW